jgi:hypothetical protein
MYCIPRFKHRSKHSALCATGHRLSKKLEDLKSFGVNVFKPYVFPSTCLFPWTRRRTKTICMKGQTLSPTTEIKLQRGCELQQNSSFDWPFGLASCKQRGEARP